MSCFSKPWIKTVRCESGSTVVMWAENKWNSPLPPDRLRCGTGSGGWSVFQAPQWSHIGLDANTELIFHAEKNIVKQNSTLLLKFPPHPHRSLAVMMFLCCSTVKTANKKAEKSKKSAAAAAAAANSIPEGEGPPSPARAGELTNQHVLSSSVIRGAAGHLADRKWKWIVSI